jgi:uncharacterized lipoprotein YddW (UPF0748 family)
MTRLPTMLLAAVLALGVVQAATPPVWIVRGTVSTPNEAERNAAKSATRRLDRWLTDLAVPHEVVDDELAMQGIPDPVRVLILGYNPRPKQAEIDAVTAFLNRGGKLLAFHSSAPEIAAAVGVRFGEYATSGMDPRWSVMRFAPGAPPHLPATVRQDSRSVRPVFPLDNRARVIARWETAAGEALPEPAWVQSERGFWMSHLLLDDGDTPAKKRLLLGLLGALYPPVWADTARHAVKTAGTLGRYPDAESAIADIRKTADKTRPRPNVDDALAAAETCRRTMQQALAESRLADVMEAALALDGRMIEAHARLLPPRADERRGVWNHSGAGLYPGDWPKTCRFLVEHGVTDIFPNMLWPGLAHYPSRVVARSDTAARYGDQMLQCTIAARRAGLRVHVWKVCWKMQFAPDDVRERWRKEGRCQVKANGEIVEWLCPSRPENVHLELKTIAELLDAYTVDGLHLDYVRRPDSECCFCSACRREFEKTLGQSVGNWPADVLTGRMKQGYTRWRAAQMTHFVGQAADLARKMSPGIEVSAAVYGGYPGCIVSIAQDWGAWLRNGSIDFACPMNYTEDLDQFTTWTRNQLDLLGDDYRLYPGIGVTSAQSRLNPIQALDQILAARRLGAPGFILFDLTPVLETETLPALRCGATSGR